MMPNESHGTGLTSSGDGEKTTDNNDSIGINTGGPAAMEQFKVGTTCEPAPQDSLMETAGGIGAAAFVSEVSNKNLKVGEAKLNAVANGKPCHHFIHHSQQAADETNSRQVAMKNEDCSADGRHRLKNGIWVNDRASRIVSVFGINEAPSCKIQKRLEGKKYKSVYPEQEELIVPESSEVKVSFKCMFPADMEMSSCRNNPLILNGRQLTKKAHRMYFKPLLRLDHEQHQKHCEALYYATARKNNETSDSIEASLKFHWLCKVQDEITDLARASTSAEHFDTVGDEHIDGQGQRLDLQRRMETASWANANDDQDHTLQPQFIADSITDVKQHLHVVVSSSDEVDSGGNFIQLGDCGVKLPSGVVKKRTEVTISVAECLDSPLPPFTPVSRALKCKPSDFGNQIGVNLKSFLHPKQGKKLVLTIMSKTGNEDWKETSKICLASGNNLELKVPHFCWYVAVVTEEEEQNGEYHLFNDVFMDLKTGHIISLFCKDDISLEKASKAFDVSSANILPLSEELIVSIGDTVKVNFDSPPGIKIESMDNTNAQFQITHESMKNNFFLLFFRQVQDPDKIPSSGYLEGFYNVKIFDKDDKPTGEECSVPLDLPVSWYRSLTQSAAPATEVKRKGDEGGVVIAVPEKMSKPDVIDSEGHGVHASTASASTSTSTEKHEKDDDFAD